MADEQMPADEAADRHAGFVEAIDDTDQRIAAAAVADRHVSHAEPFPGCPYCGPVRVRGGDVRDVPAAIRADAEAIEAEQRAAAAPPLPEPPVEPQPLDPARPIIDREPDAPSVVLDRDGDAWVRLSGAVDATWQCLAGPMHSWADIVRMYGPMQLVADQLPMQHREPAAAPPAGGDPYAAVTRLTQMVVEGRAGGRLAPSDVQTIAHSVAMVTEAASRPATVDLDESLAEVSTTVDNPGTALRAAVALLRPAEPVSMSRSELDRLLVAVRRTARTFERHLDRDRTRDDELGEVCGPCAPHPAHPNGPCPVAVADVHQHPEPWCPCPVGRP